MICITRKLPYRGRIQRKTKTWCMGPYDRVDYNLTLCPPQSRLQHIYHGVPSSTLTLCQSRLYPPVRDFGFGLCMYIGIETTRVDMKISSFHFAATGTYILVWGSRAGCAILQIKLNFCKENLNFAKTFVEWFISKSWANKYNYRHHFS